MKTIVITLAALGCGACGAGTDSSEVPTVALGAATAPMGAIVHAGGTSFRVWAPHASAVSLVGDFGSHGMASLGDGTWLVDVAGARAGQSYQYAVQYQGQTLMRADPRSFQVVPDAERPEPRSVIYDQSAYAWRTPAFSPPPYQEQVIYELHLGTFADTHGAGTGTWASATAKLGYLQALGVNMIEVLPPNEFSSRFSWGYNPTYPLAPAGAYGSPDDAKRFVDSAHGLGMGVIIDVVHNHYSRDGFIPSMSMWCFDGPCPNNGGVYFYAEATPWGPRPNYGDPHVHDFIIDSLLMWERDYHADGFRWDSSIYTRRTDWNVNAGHDIPEGARLLKDMNAAVHRQNPAVITIAEDLAGWGQITSPENPATVDQYGSGFGFDSQWDDSFFYSLKSVMTAPSDAARDLNALVGALRTSFGGVASHRVVYTEDHDKVAPQNGGDKVRIPEAVWPGHADSYYARKRSSLGAAIALTAPGVPMLFMGQEFVENTPFPFNQGQALDWSKTQRFGGIVQLYTDLIHLRLNRGNATRGLGGNSLNVFHVDQANKIAAYHRWDAGGPGDDVIVVVNFSDRAMTGYQIGLPRGGAWHVRFNGDSSAYSADFGNLASNDVAAALGNRDGLNYNGAISIGAYSMIILSQ
jgi:1,4-alpha-glucan branching enzyme